MKIPGWQDIRAVSYTHLDVYKRQGLIKKSAVRTKDKAPTAADITFLAEDTNTDEEYVKNVLAELGLI